MVITSPTVQTKLDILSLLQIVDARNVLVVVSRWYGGIMLGPDRFKHINNCTRSILEEHNFIKDKVRGNYKMVEESTPDCLNS